ncbi:MAG: hypothetical protein AAB385_03300, partial [Planctomycetota bacterium]
TDFAVDPAHATLGNPHEVASPSFANFQLTIYGTFDVTKCYQVVIKREGGAPCGSANSSGTDTADVFADHLVADISPEASADFKVASNWRIEIAERSAGCSGGSDVQTFPDSPGEPYLRIRGCNNHCLLSGTTLTAHSDDDDDCGGEVQLCVQQSGGGTLGSGNLEYDWDLDGDGVCGVCSGGSNNRKKCGEPSDCPGGICFGGGGFDDLTTNTGDPGCLPDQPCCITVSIFSTQTVGVKVRDKGTNVPCTECKTIAVNDDDDDDDDCDDDDDGCCDDNLFCNGLEFCDDVLGCQRGTPPNCNDGVPCTIDSCNEATDTCDHTPNHALCSNGLFCDGTETCHPTLGCVPGTPPNCNDGNACTTDACTQASGCTHTPINCNDGNVCTTDTCDPTTGCVFTNNNNA